MKRLIGCAAALALVISSSFASAADVAEHQWVRVSEDGTVQGRVVVPRSGGIAAARGANISLVDQNGQYANSVTESDKTGRFTLEDVRPGVYTLLIQGDDAFACCALHIVSSDVSFSDEFEIAAGAVKYSVVRNAIARYLPQGQSTKIEFDPSTNPMKTDRVFVGQSVRFGQYNGGLRGRLTRAGFTENLGAKESNVLIYRDGIQVARTVTDSNGNFYVADLEPGSYSILGSGEDGFGLMGIELVNPLSVQLTADDDLVDAKFVVQSDGVSDTFIMQVAPGPITIDEELLEDREVLAQMDGSVAPMDSGDAVYYESYGGGGGGGGGGFGGGGGIWALAGLAGLAGIAGSGDSGVVVPPVTSDANP